MQLIELLNKFFTDCFKSEAVRDSFKGKMEKVNNDQRLEGFEDFAQDSQRSN